MIDRRFCQPCEAQGLCRLIEGYACRHHPERLETRQVATDDLDGYATGSAELWAWPAPIWAGWLRVEGHIAWPGGSTHGETFTPATPVAPVPHGGTHVLAAKDDAHHSLVHVCTVAYDARTRLCASRAVELTLRRHRAAG